MHTVENSQEMSRERVKWERDNIPMLFFLFSLYYSIYLIVFLCFFLLAHIIEIIFQILLIYYTISF